MKKVFSTVLLPEEKTEELKLAGVEVIGFPSEKALAAYDAKDCETVTALIANHRTLQVPLLEMYPALQWVHVPHIGVERLPMEYLEERSIRVTNARGSVGIPIAEDIICKMLALSRKYSQMAVQQCRKEWRVPTGIVELWNKTIGILGTGDVGTETAKRAKVFGMKTIGLNSSGKSVEFFDQVFQTGQINALIEKSDYIVCALALTKETYHLIGAEQFKRMKAGTFIINVSRGDIIDEAVLLEYLDNSKIAGAALDVFHEEFANGRLSEESPFWDIPGVIVTPHMAASSDNGNLRQHKIIIDNLKLFGADRLDDLVNLRDYRKGY